MSWPVWWLLTAAVLALALNALSAAAVWRYAHEQAQQVIDEADRARNTDLVNSRENTVRAANAKRGSAEPMVQEPQQRGYPILLPSQVNGASVAPPAEAQSKRR